MENEPLDAYEHGLVIEKDRDGYAVFTGCAGDCPEFCAFFADRSLAEAFALSRDPEDPECALVCDSQVVVATLNEHGVVAANDTDIETHQQLRDRFREASEARHG